MCMCVYILCICLYEIIRTGDGVSFKTRSRLRLALLEELNGLWPRSSEVRGHRNKVKKTFMYWLAFVVNFCHLSRLYVASFCRWNGVLTTIAYVAEFVLPIRWLDFYQLSRCYNMTCWVAVFRVQCELPFFKDALVWNVRDNGLKFADFHGQAEYYKLLVLWIEREQCSKLSLLASDAIDCSTICHNLVTDFSREVFAYNYTPCSSTVVLAFCASFCVYGTFTCEPFRSTCVTACLWLSSLWSRCDVSI